MKPYNPGTRCKKCDNQGANARYVKASASFGASRDEDNWIERTCRRCGYSWDEGCLDTKS